MDDQQKPTRPGDPCQCAGCGGKLYIHTTRVNERIGKRIRYMRCDTCHLAPERNIWVLPLEYAPLRRSQKAS